MRNFSMKKFGTPIGAGPRSAIETVGLSSVGVPSASRIVDSGASVVLVTQS